MQEGPLPQIGPKIPQPLPPAMNMTFTPDDRMISIIASDYKLIQIMSRFGIKVGFGDKTVAEVCRLYDVDCSTFLTVVNFTVNGFSTFDPSMSLSPASLMLYLRQSHAYFLDFFLPSIRRKLLDGIKMRASDVSFLILKFFDEYTLEVRTHMEYEEKTVFGYITALLSGSRSPGYAIATYSHHHEQVGAKLKELKSLIIRYCPEDADANLLNDALYDIYRCEQELENHCMVEDCLLVPLIMKLEADLESEGSSGDKNIRKE